MMARYSSPHLASSLRSNVRVADLPIHCYTMAARSFCNIGTKATERCASLLELTKQVEWFDRIMCYPV